MRLDSLDVNTKAKIIGVSQSVDKSLRRRLLDMGITPGTTVEIVRKAPLGDPIELNLRDYFLTIRKADATLVEVEINV